VCADAQGHGLISFLTYTCLKVIIKPLILSVLPCGVASNKVIRLRSTLL